MRTQALSQVNKRDELRRSGDRFTKSVGGPTDIRTTTRSMNRYKPLKDSERGGNAIDNNKNLMLDLVNKVEMFKIVTEKVNM